LPIDSVRTSEAPPPLPPPPLERPAVEWRASDLHVEHLFGFHRKVTGDDCAHAARRAVLGRPAFAADGHDFNARHAHRHFEFLLFAAV
jgi:hypothetical protein